MKSRFAIIGALAAMLLALLYVAPVFAGIGWTSVNQGTGETAQSLSVGVLDPAAAPGVAYGAGTDTKDTATTTDDTTIVRTTFNASSYLSTGNLLDSTNPALKYTKVGNTVWVGAGGNTPWGDIATDAGKPRTVPYSLVYVRVDDEVVPDNDATTEVAVTNITSGQAVTAKVNEIRDDEPAAMAVKNGRLVLQEPSNGDFHGYFFVVKSVDETLGLLGGHPYVVASDMDTIQVTGAGGLVRTLRVDAAAPVVSGAVPLHNSVRTSAAATFSATITDSGSGLAPDVAGEDNDSVANDSQTGNARPTGSTDGDADGVTAEPRALPSPSGASRDIDINTGLCTNDDLTPNSARAGSGWTTATNGFTFTFTHAELLGPGTLKDGKYCWQVVASDRVNNTRTTDADSAKTGADPYVINIDGSNPAIGRALAGVGYDAKTRKDVPNSSSIKLEFTADGADPTTSNVDWLDSASIDADGSDFRVDASTASTATLAIAGAIHPNHTADSTTGVKDTRNVVYLTLSSPLAANARPEVNLIGNVLDRSGRASIPHAEEAEERINPTLGVTVSGPAEGRPVVTGGATNKAVIRITADETLTRTPTVYLMNFKLSGDADNPVAVDGVPTMVSASAVSGSANTWEVQAAKGTLNGLTGVWVSGEDLANPANEGTTAGVTVGSDDVPSEGDLVDLTKMALFEFDGAVGAVEVSLTPSTKEGGNSTESSSPFVRIDFAEGMEYSLGTGADAKDSVGFGTPPTNVEIDSHNAVMLTKLSITDSDGVVTDLLGQEGSVDADSFIVALSDLAQGTYTVHVNGTDAAGNSLPKDHAYALHVVARKPFAATLSPGWNLVSVPGDPSDPSLDSVLPSSHPAKTVLAYAPNDPNGPWLTATRAAGMDWSDNASNTLSEIRAGHGYWVETTAFVGLSTLIPERPAAAVPPTYAVSAGWNLLGVTDVTLPKAGTEVGTAKDYLASLSWSVAYTFNTQKNEWTKHTANTADEKLEVGQGVWVYARQDGALAP